MGRPRKTDDNQKNRISNFDLVVEIKNSLNMDFYDVLNVIRQYTKLKQKYLLEGKIVSELELGDSKLTARKVAHNSIKDDNSHSDSFKVVTAPGPIFESKIKSKIKEDPAYRNKLKLWR